MASTAVAVLDYPLKPDGSYGANIPQQRAHAAADACDELLYGGAAGGGKTAWVIAEVLSVLFRFPGANGAIFRRTHDQLIELGGIANTLLERIPPSLGHYNVQERTWKFVNGSKLRLNYVARDADVTKFQGAQYAILAFDQVEQFTEYQYTYLIHRLRVSGELAAAMESAGYRPKVISTANPAGVGQYWVKRRFINAYPKGGVIWQPMPTEADPYPGTRCFIPARVYDNLENMHPSYLAKLQQLPEELRRAMLDGDWSVTYGQKFNEFRPDVHVVDPSVYPMHMLIPQRRGVGVDYGMEAPFCALWGAKLPDGLIVIYRELYKAGLTPAEQAKLILASEMPSERTANRPVPVALDPSCWARTPHDLTEPDPKTGAPAPSSIAGAYWRNGVQARRAYNHRLPGVARMHEKLRRRDDGMPRLIITSNCRNLIRTLPELVADRKDPEDVDTTGEDHAFDAAKYLLFLLEPMDVTPEGRKPEPPDPSAADIRRQRLREAANLATGATLTGVRTRNW